MADEFRFDAAGFMGNSIARTPNLDRLAAGAVVFDNAYTPSPVCVPSRQCLATGRYPVRAGCVQFGDDIAPGSPTFARWFSERGYYTVACGKLHHRGPDQMQGWIQRIGAETAVRWPAAYAERNQVGRRKWKGADDVLEAGVGESPLGLHDDLTIHGARDFLRMHFGNYYAVPSDVPLLLKVSLQQPHFPLRTEQELFDYYYDKVPIYENQPAAENPLLNIGRLDENEGVTPDHIRRATATYYGMIEQTDRRIGEVIRTLEEAGQSIDDWVIIFTADHGEMLGEHGLWEKRKFYEASARIPMFIRGPGLAPARSDTLVNLVDLYPTMAALAGLPAPSDIDGRDIFAPERADETFSQHTEDKFMLRTGSWKYILLGDGSEVLFDLASDPKEVVNQISNPAYQETAERLRSRVAAFRQEQEELRPAA